MLKYLIHAIVRRTNQAAPAEGSIAPLATDQMGRLMTRPYLVRDLLTTASATLTTGTATTLLSGTSGYYMDLKQLTMANNSDVAALVALLDESTTIRTFLVPARNSVSFAFEPALKQSATGVNWLVDMEDITGTTIYLAAEYSREV